MQWIRNEGRGKWKAEAIVPGEPVRLAPRLTLLAPANGRGCLLLAGTAAFVNGEASLPLRWLEHRDEIRAGGQVWYFSAETPLTKEEYAAGPKALRCGCCKEELAGGAAVVRCPLCRAAYHEACWPYAPACGTCGRPTKHACWTPEEGGPGDE